MICIAVKGSAMRDLLKNLRSASQLLGLPAKSPSKQQTGYIEIRADSVPDFSLATLLNQKILPAIFTCYSKANGGSFSGTENERLKLLSSAISSGKFKYVTIDIPNPLNISKPIKLLFNSASRSKTKIILAYHNYQQTPDDLERFYQRLSIFKPAVIKIVTYACAFSDNFKIFELAKMVRGKQGSKLIAFCMGEKGIISRILYKKFGLFLTYASNDGLETAEGQIPFSAMKYLYRADSLNPETRIFGLLGYPIRHSLSPLLFNHLFETSGLNAIYLPFAIKPASFSKDFSQLNSYLKPDGYSVTIPYKMKVMKLVNRLDTVAGEIKAVNTVYRKDNKLIGTNTDWLGVSDTLAPSLTGQVMPEADLSKKRPALGTASLGSPVGALHKDLQNRQACLTGRQALILGNGGAARAVRYALDKMGVKSTMFARHPKNAKKEIAWNKLLSARGGPARRSGGSASGTGVLPWDCLRQYCQGEGKDKIIINATPVGMFPEIHKSPVSKSLLKKRMIVFDLIYNPIETRLLKEAKGKGCRVINGMQMFLTQAMKQFEYFRSRTLSQESHS